MLGQVNIARVLATNRGFLALQQHRFGSSLSRRSRFTTPKDAKAPSQAQKVEHGNQEINLSKSVNSNDSLSSIMNGIVKQNGNATRNSSSDRHNNTSKRSTGNESRKQRDSGAPRKTTNNNQSPRQATRDFKMSNNNRKTSSSSKDFNSFTSGQASISLGRDANMSRTPAMNQNTESVQHTESATNKHSHDTQSRKGSRSNDRESQGTKRGQRDISSQKENDKGSKGRRSRMNDEGLEEEEDFQRSKNYKSKEKAKTRPSVTTIEKKTPQINIPKFITVSNLSSLLKVKLAELLKSLEKFGFENMTHDYILDAETASLIVQEYGLEAVTNEVLGADLYPTPISTDPTKVEPRPPIVTIMGHVDHGKTTILDYLRKSSIVKGEHGGITQHIGAFSVKTPLSKKVVTFLDTPGHAAFLKMRERGANMTDIVVLVVAAEDSVMPQTIEAIKHAKNAGVSIVVAVNKCDKQDADPDKVIADLSRHGIDVEDYGGEVPVVRVSAKTGMNMDALEEAIVTVAELLELKAEFNNVPVEGWVVESQMKKGLGNVATFVVKKGTLKNGTILVAGTTWCKVKAMKDEFGKPLKTAGPSVPVELIGWKDLPEAGEVTIEAKSEALAKQVIENRIKRNAILTEHKQVDLINKQRLVEFEKAEKEEKIQEYLREGLTLDDIKELEPELFEDVHESIERVPFIIRGDVSGSVEAVTESIKDIGNEEVKVQVIHQDVGPPTESDVERASVAGATILAFNIDTPKDVMSSAARAGVEIKYFNVIYHLIESVIETVVDKLPPLYEVKVLATATVKEIFEVTVKKSKVKIAGSKVTLGPLKRSGLVRVMRDDEEVYRGSIKQLKVHQDDVQEVRNGSDCGICLDDSNFEILAGDMIQNIEEHRVARQL